MELYLSILKISTRTINSHVIILGYMASGKSSLAKYIGNLIGLKYIDLDDFIVNKHGMSISDMFNFKGEIEFRKIEHTSLKELLNSKEKFIISLGGGTPCYSNNMKLIVENSKKVFFINTPNNILAKRLFYEKKKRPLVSSIDSIKDMLEYVSKHLFERFPFYNQAHYKINVNEKSVSEISKEIIEKINL